MISPIWTYTLLTSPRSHTPRNAPKTPSGMPKSTEKGTDQLSYWAARKRNTKMMARPKIMPWAPPDSFSW